MKRNIIFVLALIGALLLGSTGGAVADRLITGHDVKNNSLTGADVKNGSVKLRDLSPGARAWIKAQAGKPGKNGSDGHDGANGSDGANGQDGAPGSAAGVQTNWEEKNGVVIISDTSVRLSNFRTPDGASIEIQNLNLPVQTGKKLSFTYELSGGAVYGGGSPRVFFEINGNFYNTHDGDPSDVGVDNGDGTFTKTITIPQNGRIGAAGVVVDHGIGSVLVSDVTVAGQVLHFR